MAEQVSTRTSSPASEQAVMEEGDHLRIHDLKVGFKTLAGFRPVLDLSELTIAKGASFGLVGESGAGKSVLALTIMRLLPSPPATIEAAEMHFLDTEIMGLSKKEMRALRGKEMAMIFQDPMSSLNPVFTVGSHLVQVVRRRTGANRRQATERARELISLVELPDPDNMLAKYPHQLSGGQRQRVIIALALSCGAQFLIADEPTRNLDVTVQAGVLKTIAGLRQEFGVTMLFIANNLGLVAPMCDRVGVLQEGRIVETGTVEEVGLTPLHPYTVNLMRAIPSREEAHADETRIAASAQGGVSGSGCAFYHRCAEHSDDCLERPVLVCVDGTHSVACWQRLPGGRS
jgi:oligopeptide/dipeptide ABC transporter ATP-binding protein